MSIINKELLENSNKRYIKQVNLYNTLKRIIENNRDADGRIVGMFGRVESPGAVVKPQKATGFRNFSTPRKVNG